MTIFVTLPVQLIAFEPGSSVGKSPLMRGGVICLLLQQTRLEELFPAWAGVPPSALKTYILI